MTEYRASAHRIDCHGSLAVAKEAEVILDTDIAGRRDAMNPLELLLSALAACMLKGIERVTPMLAFRCYQTNANSPQNPLPRRVQAARRPRHSTAPPISTRL